MKWVLIALGVIAALYWASPPYQYQRCVHGVAAHLNWPPSDARAFGFVANSETGEMFLLDPVRDLCREAAVGAWR